MCQSSIDKDVVKHLLNEGVTIAAIAIYFEVTDKVIESIAIELGIAIDKTTL